MEGRPKIEIVRVPSNERGNFRSLDGVRNNYSHIRVGAYYPEPEVKVVVCDSKPPIEQSRKFKKHLGPVSKLLRRRHHATYLATKSCDNIYSVNRSTSSLDWRVNQTTNEKGLQSRQSNSLDWRVGRSINKLHWRDTTRSAEQLSRSGAISSDHLQTPSTKSKLISLLRRLSPRLSRPGSKNSLQASPTICPWVQVEYSSESINDGLREDSQENDVSFQRELQLNELRKRMAGIPTTSQVTTKVVKDGKGQQTCTQIRIQVQEPENDYTNASNSGKKLNSVHKERGDEDRRRASGQTRGGGEVAGLEDVGDCCAATLTPSVPGAAGIRSNRRTRPLSLAVQPLNYRRLDPDPKIAINIVTSHHPNMTSQESIGSCSLDVDQSASDRSENTIDTISKKTLHSLNLSCNGDSVSSSDNLANGSSETLQKSHLTPDEKLNVSNGHRSSPEPEQLTVKKPSYLGLACSISGYSGINRYDSKLREGFRSRDSSPGTRLITRDTSPASFRSNEYLNVPAHPHPPKSQSISPLAMDRQNGFSNGLKEECKVEAYRESRNSIGIYQGYSEVDKGVLTTFPEISPVISSTPTKRSPGVSQMMSCSQQQNKHFSVTSPKRDAASLASASLNETNVLNGSTEEVGSQVLTNTPSSEKSFIQQRVERLYGPGALAQENANTEESLKNLPVLRHLRPEFRAQLPVVSPRRPTDGSEQILKPLQRVSPVSRKVEQKAKIPAATNLDGNLSDSNAQELSSSVTSIPDQQPAAPKVVLPVLESSASSTNVAKQVQEAEKTVEEKNGHYFMKLLKQETDRLLSLAALAEAELSSSGDSVPLPEEAAGKLRSAAGKARLLASQKMQQFEGLCQKNINQVPGEEFPTTNEDLAGFWDMVMLQVVQVNELFDQIEKLRSSQWQETVPEKKTITSIPQNGTTAKRRVPPIHKSKSTANSEANKKAREAREQARRQLIEEKRRAMRSNAQNSENTVKIFAPDT
ncbi:disks large-associated protein 4 isoform X13 [Apis cerana]|uniref:disks large-associated protein 4 isoform X13 n=1 Tax=Apis cerana TaxID=7461 RepID=UPI002B23B028|nr:disks large-associated protein 4 isoform X13 [Apis cerana]